VQAQANALLASLKDFIAQPDYPTLVLNGADASMVFPSRSLAAFDRQDDGNYYLLFPQPLTDAKAYMGVVAESLTQQLEVLNTELAARQLEPLPTLPTSVMDARYPLGERMRAAVQHCGQHLPGGAPIVWGFLPGELSDVAGYRQFVGPLLAEHEVEPWMERHRFIIRDSAPSSPLTKQLHTAKNDRVLVMELDFSSEGFVQGLLDTVSNKGAAPDARMDAFFQLAAVDFAFKRYPQALEKYGACFNYFDQKGNKPMQALCLSGAGDTQLRSGKPVEALKFYQQSLALGVEEKNLPVIQVSTFGAGNACLELARHEEAEGYFKHADDASAKMHNPFAKCDAMEKRGLAAWQQGKVEQAIDIWTKGKELAKQFSYSTRAISILGGLIELSRKAGPSRRLVELEAEKAALEKSEGASPVPGGQRA
jgi:hypothetical protein